MIRYRLSVLQTQQVIVFLDADSPNATALLQYEGDAGMVEFVRDVLSVAFGAFGHRIGSATTPIDLDAAMKNSALAQWQPELIEGAELVASYDPGIPEGAVT